MTTFLTDKEKLDNLAVIIKCANCETLLYATELTAKEFVGKALTGAEFTSIGEQPASVPGGKIEPCHKCDSAWLWIRQGVLYMNTSMGEVFYTSDLVKV